MNQKKTNLSGYVKTQTLVFSVFVAFFLGFFGGVVLTVFKSGGGMPAGVTPGQMGADRRDDTHAAQITELENAVARNPDNTDLWLQLGHLYFDSDRYEKAIDAYRKVLETVPDNPDVWTDLGVMYRRNRQPEKAVESFDRAIAIDPGHQIAWFNKGIVLIHDLKQTENGIQAWTRLAELNPQAKAPNGQLVTDLIKQFKAM